LIKDGFMSTAPTSILTLVEGTYNTWREHHSECEICSLERDWYNPGFPAIVDDPAEANGTQVTKDGHKVHLAHRADPESVLCPDGVRKFKDWVRATTLSSWTALSV